MQQGLVKKLREHDKKQSKAALFGPVRESEEE